MHWLDRTKILIGEDAVLRLAGSRIAVLGLGGVGSAAAEAVCRAGVGTMLVVDCDCVDVTNINRQILATTQNIGKRKCDEAEKRLHAINPELELVTHDEMLTPNNLQFLVDFKPDYIIDAIDNITAKLALVQLSKSSGIPLVMCLGTGNRLAPEMLRIGDLTETSGSGCRLSRTMRKELRRRGIEHQEVLYSTEEALVISVPELHFEGRHSPASMAFVPPAAGFLLGSYVVRKILAVK